MEEAKLYKLQPNTHYGFYVGRTKHGLQAIVGYYDNLLITVLFDAQGNFTSAAKKPFISLHSAEYDNLHKQLIDELGLSLQPITVKQFFLEDYDIGIQEMSADFEYFLAHEAEYSASKRKDYHEMITDWKNSGDFVFQWNNDFWCDKDGYIIAS
jgi:hypothetical protein